MNTSFKHWAWAITVLAAACGCNTTLAAPATAATQASAHGYATRNENTALGLLKTFETTEVDRLPWLINPDEYIQHNQSGAPGIEGLTALLQSVPKGTFTVKPVRVFQDNDYVIVQSDFNIFGPQVGFDIFRFEQGRIVEHWDNLQATPTSLNPSGHSMLDGPTVATDLRLTKANKALARSFVHEVLVNGRREKLPEYFNGDNYIQHNPQIPDTVSGLSAALQNMATAGKPVKYDRIHKTLGEGNFVLVVSEGAIGDQPTAFYDLFRVEQGKLAEHWDVVSRVLPQSESRNWNGKFDF